MIAWIFVFYLILGPSSFLEDCASLVSAIQISSM